MRPTAGTALGARYRLDRQIAVGGMGEVWVAHDLSLRRDVAVKVLREEFAGDPGFLERFRTEARNAASLSHPNIAATYDYGEQQGSSYLVMELVTGEPLSDLLEREPVLDDSRLLPVLAQTARALHAAHLAGVVHRDVKPGNILLGRGGRVKITDFGVSTAPDQAPMTATGMVMGTAQYLSPEQAVGRPATALSDLYSLGVVAYEALAGHRPFTGPTAVDIAVAHVNTPVPPLPPTVSRTVAELVLRLLAKDPADRPRSAGALARTLDAMVGHTPPDGVPVPDDAATRDPERAGRSAGAVPAPAAVQAASVPAGFVPPASVPGASAPRASTPPVIAPAARSTGAGHGTGAARPGSVPPSYPPRRELRDPRTGASRPTAARPPTHPPATVGPGPVPGAAADGTARTGARTTAAGAGATAAPAAAAGATRASAPVRTSTTTGRRLGRFGRWSWPLVALVALLVALALAALADSVGGTPAGAAADGAVVRCDGLSERAPTGIGAMITPCAPPGDRTATTLSTAKDA